MKHMLAGVIAVLTGVTPVLANPPGLALRDSFRVGTGGVLCTAQWRGTDPALRTVFDRSYAIVCRDAASAVGKAFVFQQATAAPDPLAVFRENDAGGLTCEAAQPARLTELPTATQSRCQLGPTGLNYFIYVYRRGTTVFAAMGLAGYDSALKLALRSIASDREMPGIVDVAATEAGDPAAFARVQAGNLDPDDALAQGYLRNNAGSFAESSEFFDLLVERNQRGTAGFSRSAEYLANEALQQSNLGSFAEADALFARAARIADPQDAIVARLLRNFRGMHELNRGRPLAALGILNTRLAVHDEAMLDAKRVANGFIDRPIAQRLNGGDDAVARLGGLSARLSPEERAAILDAQSLSLEGSALRLTGRADAAKAALANSLEALDAVRGGQVASMTWLKSSSLTELAAIAEAAGKPAEARAALVQAITIYAVEHPGSAALLAAQARLASLSARQGDRTAAIAGFAQVVAASPSTPGASQAIRSLMGPYFELLSADSEIDHAAEFFAASQMLARPGVAQTQAVLARELSGGSDEAAGLFRQSLTLSRDIVRADVEIGRLSEVSEPDPAALSAARAQRETLSREQTAIVARLAAFPRYRAIANAAPSLAELQQVLKEDEAYYKLVLVGADAYGLFATQHLARTFRIAASVADLEAAVAKIRDSIVRIENGQIATYPFDAVAALALYRTLFGPVDGALRTSRHLIFEPDGAMLQLPVTLLISDPKGVDAYTKRNERADADAFDMTGISWLGRDHIVSTAVSPRAFMDVRGIAGSKAANPFLGFGANSVPQLGNAAFSSASRGGCVWPASAWSSPISDAELQIGARLLGADASDVITGAAFTDNAILSRGDLRNYRVVHFATHGLVTAPRPDCPAEPALLTSFGASGSDGLLSFREIFDLRLDADMIVLSACDTAGMATLSATRAAGVSTGGNFALDGLVRAFVGAGARAVVASHWPVPDDFDATRILMSGLYTKAGSVGIGQGLRASQIAMMDNPLTSHPYYWAAFAVIGDAAKPLRPSVGASGGDAAAKAAATEISR